ncbi:hypothetical protein [Streptomyces sp. bgisy126]|uniref:hypothetical protein n=1 Tax=unclassified Streptomyces TaxID=2593676 RepID=UPI003EC08ED5
MGNSRAYAVFRTTDAAAAYARAERLCGLLEERDDEVGLFAELRTVAELRAMAEILPGARYDYVNRRTGPDGEDVWFDLDVDATDDATLEPHLPLDLFEDAPTGSVEDRFVRVLGRGTAAVDWCGLWPDDPESDRYPSAKYDGVQVVFHGEEAQWDRWSEYHTVFVHVSKFGDLSRARKLAAYIGGEALGEPQLGW